MLRQTSDEDRQAPSNVMQIDELVFRDPWSEVGGSPLDYRLWRMNW